MFDALARLADRRPRRLAVAALVFFIAAGALGGSVAGRLDPYGADDPSTESARAKALLARTDFRELGAIVLVEDAPVRSTETRRRVGALARTLRARRDVAEVTGFYDTGSRDFISNDREATYLAVALRPEGDK